MVERVNPLGRVTLVVSFGNMENPRTEYITFEVVDIPYPYNVIFGRGGLNAFEAAVQPCFLCIKIPGPKEVITIHGDQATARDIEKAYGPG